ncbi:uncharacterized protein LOC129755174 [Uranotaenia lowii]|uniref:uncharacterized protein LOC129755174 n=1 Tax=Uranotaenia lowii TaxID=190385 RepID=UPI0024791746|nr:uncharacterized protein LOC129755174 [Uranotaenia lowii]
MLLPWDRFWIHILMPWFVLVVYQVVCVSCQKNGAVVGDFLLSNVKSDEARANALYYATLWYRFWEFPLIITIKWAVLLAVVLFTFGTTAIQGLKNYKSADEGSHGPIYIDGHVESYGAPSSWFSKWG